MLEDASEEIDLLDYNLIEQLETPGTVELLAAKAAGGCQVRILIATDWSESVRAAEYELESAQLGRDGDSDQRPERKEIRDQIARSRRQLEDLFERPGLQAREYDSYRYNTILRFDEQMLVTLHVWGTRNRHAPLLYLRRDGDGGLFDQFANHFESIWQNEEAYPIEPPAEVEMPPERDPDPNRAITQEEYEVRVEERTQDYEVELAEVCVDYQEDIDILRELRRQGRRLEQRGEDPRSRRLSDA